MTDAEGAFSVVVVARSNAGTRTLRRIDRPVTLHQRTRHLIDACTERALALWPRLSRSRLARAEGDPWRIARLVSRRTAEPPEVIVAMLTGQPILPAPPDDVEALAAED